MRKAKRLKAEFVFPSTAGPMSTNQAAKQTCHESVCSGRLAKDPFNTSRAVLSDEQKSCLSKSVASITLRNGERTLFSCSGIAIYSDWNHLTRFLTSANLARALLDAATVDLTDLKIEVRHEGNKVHEGILSEADLGCNFAVVDVFTFLDVYVGFHRAPAIRPPCFKLSSSVALGRDIYGELIMRIVELSGNSSVSEDDEDLDSKISEEYWEGGPLFFLDDGSFVGMNLGLTTRKAFFLPRNTISEHLMQQIYHAHPESSYRSEARNICEASNSHLEAYKDLNQEHSEAHLMDFSEYLRSTKNSNISPAHNQEQSDLDSMCYPKLPSTKLGAGMILVNTFEETFGDKFGKGVWSKLSGKASNLKHSVVALASYNGGKRLFACTGFFIEWNGSTVIVTSASLVRNPGDENKIAGNLRIVVALPNRKRKVGKLEKYSLHHNVALVSVDYHACHPANVLVKWTCAHEVAAVGRCFESGAHEVAAVGRCFESGTLMATTGWKVYDTGALDCKHLVYSSCKITKAGIGGPLVNLDGDVIGMNFYDTIIGTPYVPWEIIDKILKLFKGESDAVEVRNASDLSFAGSICKIATDADILNSKAGEVGNASEKRYVNIFSESFLAGGPYREMPEFSRTRLNRWPVPMPCWRRRDDVYKDTSDDNVWFKKYHYENGVKHILF